MKKAIFKLIKALGIIYIILFIVFYFDLDGKLLYYVWEPFITKYYDNMKHVDKTKTPYSKLKNVSDPAL